jgi:16S rRNA (uracil1498-N3)-methyltransferase
MRRFFVEPSAVSTESGLVTVTDRNEVNHIRNVLRMKPGDGASVSDGTGTEYDCVIRAADVAGLADQAIIELTILSSHKIADSKVSVALYTGLPKQGKMEIIVQKATELGADRIVPVYMKRSVPKDRGGMAKKTERWQRVAFEASKQSRRSTVPEVTAAMDFADAVPGLSDFDLILFPYENEQGVTIKDVIGHRVAGTASTAPVRIALVIGPEGGFADEEAAGLIAAGAAACSLGRAILRTETAGMAALAMIRYAYDL